MTLEQKYHHAIIVLQAISQYKISTNEFSRSEAFYDCKEAARRCLLKLGERTQLNNERRIDDLQ